MRFLREGYNRITGLFRKLDAWFRGLINPFMHGDVERPPTSTLAFYVYFLKPVRWLLAAIIFMSLVTSVTEFALFFFMGQLVDLVTTTPPQEFFSRHAGLLIFMSVVVLLVRPVAIFLNRGLTGIGFVPGVTTMVRWRAYRYVLRQSLSFFQNDFAGRVAQKVTQAGPALRETVVNLVEGVWTLVIFVLGTVVLFGALNMWLIAPIALWVIGYGAAIVWLVPTVRVRSRAMAEANSGLSGRIVDGYTNIQSVKLFAHANREEVFARKAFEGHVHAHRELMSALQVMMSSLAALNGVLIFSVGGLALWLWSRGVTTPGDIAMATALAIRLNQMSNWILRSIASLFENIGTLQNAIDTISRDNSVKDAPEAGEARFERGEIHFDRVHFDYGGDQPVLENLSLAIRPGERIGLVGKSGAGKSTLVNLLLRFYDMQSGRIVIDGQDIRDITQESLRSEIGMVTQDTSLMHRSVRDNIRYGRPDATEEEIVAAAKRAEAHAFIQGLSDFNGRSGYDAYVGERGVKLSGGQRQRIAIARLILKDAPILILDEATSALDSEVEAAIQQQLYGLMEGRTVIAIAHRLSTIAVLDRLVVMDHGRIVESGTHQELLAAGGRYARLWERQSGGFLGLDDDETSTGTRPVAAE